MELDRVPLWRGDSVTIKQLIEDFGRYLYLPRLKDSSVLLGAVRDGCALLTWNQDSFAYAESYDEGATRYRGLRAGQIVSLGENDPGLLVKPDVARAQMLADSQPPAGQTPSGGDTATGTPPGPTPPDVTPTPGTSPTSPAKQMPRRFHGTVTLDATRVGRDAGRIAEEVITHLSGLVGANVRVTLEIEADVPDGVPDNVVRTVTENSRTLKFTSQGFEED
jgi:hypothetical protein